MSRDRSKNRNRVREVRAAHGFVRKLFGRSFFDGAEFERAITFAAKNHDGELMPSAPVIRQILSWYGDGNPGVSCRVLDAGAFSGGMLWLQSSVDRIVSGLSRGIPAVLFVTGIREAIRPGGKRWSHVAEGERSDLLETLQARIEKWSSQTNTPVSLFVA